jgi:hypothetical protein
VSFNNSFSIAGALQKISRCADNEGYIRGVIRRKKTTQILLCFSRNKLIRAALFALHLRGLYRSIRGGYQRQLQALAVID